MVYVYTYMYICIYTHSIIIIIIIIIINSHCRAGYDYHNASARSPDTHSSHRKDFSAMRSFGGFARVMVSFIELIPLSTPFTRDDRNIRVSIYIYIYVERERET